MPTVFNATWQRFMRRQVSQLYYERVWSVILTKTVQHCNDYGMVRRLSNWTNNHSNNHSDYDNTQLFQTCSSGLMDRCASVVFSVWSYFPFYSIRCTFFQLLFYATSANNVCSYFCSIFSKKKFSFSSLFLTEPNWTDRRMLDSKDWSETRMHYFYHLYYLPL